MYWGMAGTRYLGQKGYRGIGAPRGCRGPFWDVRGVLGDGRDYRYAGQKGYGGIGAPRGCRGPFWGVRGCQGCIRVASGLGTQPHWAPVQDPSTLTGSPGGVTYLAKPKK